MSKHAHMHKVYTIRLDIRDTIKNSSSIQSRMASYLPLMICSCRKVIQLSPTANPLHARPTRIQVVALERGAPV